MARRRGGCQRGLSDNDLAQAYDSHGFIFFKKNMVFVYSASTRDHDSMLVLHTRYEVLIASQFYELKTVALLLHCPAPRPPKLKHSMSPILLSGTVEVVIVGI